MVKRQPLNAVDDETPHSGKVEDVLDDHSSADQEGHLEPHDGDHRYEGVLQGMSGHDQSFPQALGPSGAHVVLTQHL